MRRSPHKGLVIDLLRAVRAPAPRRGPPSRARRRRRDRPDSHRLPSRVIFWGRGLGGGLRSTSPMARRVPAFRRVLLGFAAIFSRKASSGRRKPGTGWPYGIPPRQMRRKIARRCRAALTSLRSNDRPGSGMPPLPARSMRRSIPGRLAGDPSTRICYLYVDNQSIGSVGFAGFGVKRGSRIVARGSLAKITGSSRHFASGSASIAQAEASALLRHNHRAV
jgi:hypothetical protein